MKRTVKYRLALPDETTLEVERSGGDLVLTLSNADGSYSGHLTIAVSKATLTELNQAVNEIEMEVISE